MSDFPIFLGKKALKRILPHRGPALLISGFTYDSLCTTGEATMKVKRSHCKGHFPRHPVCPGHILVEAMAQAVGVFAHLIYDPKNDRPTPWTFRALMKPTKFVREARPGDRLAIVASHIIRKERLSQTYIQGRARIFSNGQEVASAEEILIFLPKAT
jgi:3-hydroxymyristoyl/3-hydroxydecanoyl-(acyl carrier protein) dehydratase